MNKLKLICLNVVLLMSGCAGFSVNNHITAPSELGGGTVLPTIQLRDLDGVEYTLPQDFAGDKNIVVFAFAHEQRESAESWIKALSEEVKNNPIVTLFKIPVIESKNAALRGIIRAGMSSGTHDPEARRRTLPLFVDSEDFVKVLGIKDRTAVAVFVFNKEGSVLYSEAGDPTKESLKEILKN